MRSLVGSASGESEARLRRRARGHLFRPELDRLVTPDGLGTRMATATSIMSTTGTESRGRRAAMAARVAAPLQEGGVTVKMK